MSSIIMVGKIFSPKIQWDSQFIGNVYVHNSVHCNPDQDLNLKLAFPGNVCFLHKQILPNKGRPLLQKCPNSSILESHWFLPSMKKSAAALLGHRSVLPVQDPEPCSISCFGYAQLYFIPPLQARLGTTKSISVRWQRRRRTEVSILSEFLLQLYKDPIQMRHG